MDIIYEYLPEQLVSFILVTLFSLLIGLSLRRISLKHDGGTTLFGTDRTFAFIGILGYLLYILDTEHYRLFMGGGLILGVLLGINYFVKQAYHKQFGMTTIVVALITYCLAPIVETQPMWFFLMVVVMVLLLSELKHTFTELAQRMKNDEMVTLAKFLIIAGVVLPMLPKENVIPDINLTPYSVWLATVVVSGISYLSYLLKRYVFQDSGILVSGIVGGLYSSTATISVLARQCKKAAASDIPQHIAAMLMAVSMMFLRFLVLISIFNQQVFSMLFPYLGCMMVFAAVVGMFIYLRDKRRNKKGEIQENDDSSNPLEFKVALIFALLLVVFTLLTHYTLMYAGTGGLTLLSFIAGFSDTTPFILNLLHGSDTISTTIVASCIMLAIVSSITVNLAYAIFFSKNRKEARRWLYGGFGVIIGLNLSLLAIFHFIH